MGLANSTLGRTDNKSVTELASQSGTFGKTSYALDLDYQHNDGVRPNNDLNSIEWYTTLKQQVTPQDTLCDLIKYEDYHSGDNFQYYITRPRRGRITALTNTSSRSSSAAGTTNGPQAFTPCSWAAGS